MEVCETQGGVFDTRGQEYTKDYNYEIEREIRMKTISCTNPDNFDKKVNKFTSNNVVRHIKFEYPSASCFIARIFYMHITLTPVPDWERYKLKVNQYMRW